MIKDIFVPEKIGNTYLFARRILSVYIHKVNITACQVYITGNQVTIEKCFDQPIELGSNQEHPQRVADALSVLVSQARYNYLYTTLSSTQVIFKKMTVPFVDPDKIEMVVPYEVEPLLPFPLTNAIIDFIITHINTAQKSADIFVTAIQNQYIAQHLEWFSLAGLEPNVVTIDLISIYGLLQQIPSYHQQNKKIALVSINTHDTYILYIYNGALSAVRTLSKGLFHIAKAASNNGTDLSVAQIMENMIRFGVENELNGDTHHSMEQSLKQFWQEIQFTLTSFAVQVDPQESINMILLAGAGALWKNHTEFVKKMLHIDCQVFSIDELIHARRIIIRDHQTQIKNALLATIGAVYPSSISQNFNLKKNEFATSQTGLLARQLIVATILFILILVSFFVHSFWQQRKLSHEYQVAESEVVTFLRQKFPAAEDETNPEEIRDVVEKEIQDQKRLWFGLANPDRLPLLSYLLELTNLIDKETLGFEPEKITITPDLLIIKGRVRDFEALKILERDLSKSRLFSHIEPQDNPSFTMPIRLSHRGDR